ncbi:MAG: DUF2760 domain-containing protein [Thermodesulfobacteria bacterium]|nr:DUF2760 domain-containing protein [Thermodesulfobacteriota bacterium]
MRNPKALVLLISLLVAAALGGLGYYFKDALPPWALGALVGLPLLGGALSALLLPGTETETSQDLPAEPEPPAEEAEEEKPSPPEGPPQAGPEAYLAAFLGALQKEGRFLDFLQEDLSRYDDAQIGAAVRSIHGKLKLAVFEMVDLAPVINAPEGAEILVEEDFDPKKIKLIGNVKGKPPFKGVLRHPGWRFRRLQLPKPKSGDVLAPAEVEIP